MPDPISSRHYQSPAKLDGKRLSADAKPVIKLAVLTWLAVCLQATLLASPSSHARLPRRLGPAQTTENWNGQDGNGLWSDGNNWDPATGPGGPNGNYNVVISIIGPPQPIVDVSATIVNLEIDVDESLNITDGSTLTITGSSILINGILNVDINGGGTAGALSITNTATLSGSGQTQLGSVVSSIYGPGTLINQQTIFGDGVINVANLQNQGPGGMILATMDDNPLYIGGTVTNSGVISTQSFGAVSIEPGTTVQNAGGTISGGGGGSVTLSGCTIVGGTLDRTIYQGTYASTLNGVTIAATGRYYIQSTEEFSPQTFLVGTITNDGIIEVIAPSGSALAQLTINGAVTLTGMGIGTGYVSVAGTGAKLSGSGTLTNQQTIEGSDYGNLFVNQLVNQGLVTINDGSVFNVQAKGGVTNTGGTFSASDGSLYLYGPGGFTGGTISAAPGGGASVYFGSGQTYVGVTFTGGGTFYVAVIGITFDGTTSPNTITGNSTVQVDGSCQLILTGPLTLTGTILVNATNNGTATLTINGPVTVSGPGGVIETSNNPNNAFSGTGKAGLTLDVVNLVGSGTMSGINLDASKGSVITSPEGYPLIINPNDPGKHSVPAGSGNTFKNSGLLTVASPTSGGIQVGNFSNYNSKTNTLTGGAYNLTGTFQFNNANLVTNAANINLSGNGQILNQNGANGLLNFANNGSKGVFTLSGGQSFTTDGTFANAGSLIVSQESTFGIGGSGNNYEQTAGTTTVDGALNVPAGGQANITGGTLEGAGSVSGNVSVGNASGGAATLIIGDSVKSSAVVSLANDYTQLATGVMDVQIGGTSPGTSGYSQLTVTGAVSLQGTLNIKLINKFKPTVGQTFAIVTSSSGIAGTFATVNGTSIGGSEQFAITYNSDSVVLTVESGQSRQLGYRPAWHRSPDPLETPKPQHYQSSSPSLSGPFGKCCSPVTASFFS